MDIPCDEPVVSFFHFSQHLARLNVPQADLLVPADDCQEQPALQCPLLALVKGQLVDLPPVGGQSAQDFVDINGIHIVPLVAETDKFNQKPPEGSKLQSLTSL